MEPHERISIEVPTRRKLLLKIITESVKVVIKWLRY